MNQVKEGFEHPKPTISFMIGDPVRVSDGPFASFDGTIEEVDEGKQRVKVLSRSSAGRRRSSWSSPR